ncbi:RNA polymerase sigma factor [Anaerophaga thermohalophila]|uniref:RNA polymerase sigma factor n=1 Tax=Anaerophaga thermohalophila TaxID=177400 RepID=UPI0002E1BB75|nr:RNA polymerase sigma factor [Anaerophaga thermohalophila]
MQRPSGDSELVNQAKEGQTEAFSRLVEKYRQKVFQTSMGFLHNADDAEDLTQDIFVKVWHSLKSFDGRSTFSTWLYRIAVNQAINRVRKNKLRSFVGINNEVNESQYSGNYAEENLEREEQKKQIWQAINKLKSNQKKAFVLFYYQELSIKEVAEVMDMSQKATESLVFRARKNLQKALLTIDR